MHPASPRAYLPRSSNRSALAAAGFDHGHRRALVGSLAQAFRFARCGFRDFAGGLRVACRDCASCFKEETFKRAEEELAALRAITCAHLIDLTEPEYPRCCCMFAATRKS